MSATLKNIVDYRVGTQLQCVGPSKSMPHSDIATYLIASATWRSLPGFFFCSPSFRWLFTIAILWPLFMNEPKVWLLAAATITAAAVASVYLNVWLVFSRGENSAEKKKITTTTESTTIFRWRQLTALTSVDVVFVVVVDVFGSGVQITIISKFEW